MTRLDNNGQTSILARDGDDVNDPQRTLEPIRDDFRQSATAVPIYFRLPV